MPSALSLLESCAFISMIDPAEHCKLLRVLFCLCLALSARVLSHDFTMATHSEHAHYTTKWRIRHTQLSMRHTHPLLHNYRSVPGKCPCTTFQRATCTITVAASIITVYYAHGHLPAMGHYTVNKLLLAI